MPKISPIASQVRSLTPRYGENYKRGFIGFTFKDDSFVSHGIAFMTRWDNLKRIPVSHALVVTDDSTCVEAIMGKGVVRSDLRDYFNDPHTHIFFKKPRDITDIDTVQIVSAADKEVGADYANRLIVNNFLRNTFLGHFIDEVTDNKFFDKLASGVQKQGDFICSQLAAHAMNAAELWTYRGKGILGRPEAAINPQNLSCDEVVFKPWKKEDDFF